ncbi:hypothetical protein HBB16_17820 [Pseudonocardia sp. MCCB 268]|nr:hypothetical protein [Pseudonocardia cytotoxica]
MVDRFDRKEELGCRLHQYTRRQAGRALAGPAGGSRRPAATSTCTNSPSMLFIESLETVRCVDGRAGEPWPTPTSARSLRHLSFPHPGRGGAGIGTGGTGGQSYCRRTEGCRRLRRCCAPGCGFWAKGGGGASDRLWHCRSTAEDLLLINHLDLPTADSCFHRVVRLVFVVRPAPALAELSC